MTSILIIRLKTFETERFLVAITRLLKPVHYWWKYIANGGDYVVGRLVGFMAGQSLLGSSLLKTIFYCNSIVSNNYSNIIIAAAAAAALIK